MKFKLFTLILIFSLSAALAMAAGGGGGGGGRSSAIKIDPKCQSAIVKVDHCFNEEQGFTAKFDLDNADFDDLKLEFQLASKKISYEKDSRSSFLKNLQKSSSGSEFTINVDGLGVVKVFQVSLSKCAGQYYAYSKMECLNKKDGVKGKEVEEKEVKEQNGKELKCGGYLEIEDRVRCRVNLREEQADEYENFFPEECRSWEDQGRCVALYRAVQNCWDLRASPSRISCLRGKVGLENVASQRSGCKGDKQCLDDLKENVYTLIKLRLYNLEEEAEELYEEGEITEDDLVGFVVEMEQSKSAFNNAGSKEERRNVILQARKYWLELMRKRLG